jgi:hypothetical protein
VTAEHTPEIHRRGTDVSPKVARRLRVSGIFLLLGLAIEVVSLLWSHPTSFLVFTTVGGLFLFLGFLAYLFSLVFTRSTPHSDGTHPPAGV